MSFTILLSALVGIAPGAAVIAVFWKLGSGRIPLPATTTWIDEFSAERFRPILQLLDNRDLRLLCSHSSVTPKVIAQFRGERCRILRGYLRSVTETWLKSSQPVGRSYLTELVTFESLCSQVWWESILRGTWTGRYKSLAPID